MKVWELIAELSKCPAGAEVCVNFLRHQDDRQGYFVNINMVVLEDAGDIEVSLHIDQDNVRRAFEEYEEEQKDKT